MAAACINTLQDLPSRPNPKMARIISSGLPSRPRWRLARFRIETAPPEARPFLPDLFSARERAQGRPWERPSRVLSPLNCRNARLPAIRPRRRFFARWGPRRQPTGDEPRNPMPKRTDISTILIIGAGPIIIGQACEFDYSGTQACKALRAEGYRIVLINSNPATI